MADVAQLNVRVGAKTQDFDAALSGVQNKMQQFGQRLSQMVSITGILLLTRQIVQFGKETAELEGRIQGVEAAFKRLNDPELLSNLQKATKGTVDELQLMQVAVQANNFKIPMDLFAKGLEFATRRAKETGQSVDYLVQSFTTGIGRKSMMILDNLGISVIELGKEFKKTGDFAKAVSNIIDREMKSAGSTIKTSADRAQEFKAALQDWKVTIGEDINPILDKFREKLTTLFRFMSSDPTRGQALGFLEDFKELDLKGKDLEEQIRLTAKAQSEFNEKYQQLSEDIAEKRKFGWPDKDIKGMETLSEIYRVTAEVLGEYAAKLSKSTDAGETLEEIIARLNKQSKEREALLEREIELENARFDIYKKMMNTLPGMEELFDEWKKSMPRTQGGIPGGAWGMGIELPEEEIEYFENKYGDFYRLLAEYNVNISGSFYGMSEAITEELDKIISKGGDVEEFAAKVADFANKMESFKQMIAESFYGLGEQIGSALGEMIATGESGFKQFLMIAIDFARNLGRIMIAMGIAKNVLVPGSGIGDIAAGIALSTVASGVGAYLNARSTQGTASNYSTQATFAFSGTVSGRDLKIISGRQDKFAKAVT